MSIPDFAMLAAIVSRRLSVRITRFSVYGIPYSVDGVSIGLHTYLFI